MTFGEKIRSAREDMDLTQTDMAERISINQSSYSKIERDMQEPSIDQLRKICQILKLDPRYLLGLEGYDFASTISPNDIALLNGIKAIMKKYHQ